MTSIRNNSVRAITCSQKVFQATSPCVIIPTSEDSRSHWKPIRGRNPAERGVDVNDNCIE